MRAAFASALVLGSVVGLALGCGSSSPPENSGKPSAGGSANGSGASSAGGSSAGGSSTSGGTQSVGGQSTSGTGGTSPTGGSTGSGGSAANVPSVGAAEFGADELDAATSGGTITMQMMGTPNNWYPSRRDPASGMCDARDSGSCCMTKHEITSDL